GQGGKIKISGVQIDVDCGDKLFCIDLSKQDTPYGRVIASLAECDFRSPVLFMAFTDETKRKKMFVAQAFNDEGKPMYIRPALHQEKWLSTQLSNTLKAMAKEVAKGAKWSDLLQDLSEKDRRNVAVDEQGAPLSSSQYPYIRQLSDGTWDSTAWMERL